MSIDIARYAASSDPDHNFNFSRRWVEPPRPRRLSRAEADAANRTRLHAQIQAQLRLALRAEAGE